MKLIIPFLFMVLFSGCICCGGGLSIQDEIDECTDATGDDMGCRYLVAVARGEPSLCEMSANGIDDEMVGEFISFCKAMASRDINKCMSFDESLQTPCTLIIALQKKDINLCNKLSGEDREFCKEYYVESVKECENSSFDYEMCVAEMAEF